MGRTHLRALSGTPTAVVAVAEPVAHLRSAAAEQYGLAPFESVDAMLDGGGLDGVLVVTPSATHQRVVETIVGAGLPVLCEKPCGVSVDEARAAAAAAERAGVALQVAYWRRFVPALWRMRERIGAGEFGELLSVSSLQWDGEPPAAAFRASGGGLFVDMGVHEIDQVRWLTGGEFSEITAVAATIVTDPDANEPDGAQLLGRLSTGATAYVSLGRHYPGGDTATVEVFGTRGHGYIRFLDPADGERVQLDALAAQAAAFAELARGGVAEGASAADAVAALGVALEASAQIVPRS